MLISLVPLFSIPFTYESYTDELEKLIRIKFTSALSFILLTLVSMQLFSSVMQIASVMIVYNLLSPYAGIYNAQKPFIKTISRGYGSSGFWSPAWTSIVIYSVYPEISWSKILPVGIVFSLLYMGMHLLITYCSFKKNPERYPDAVPSNDSKPDNKKLMRLLGYITVMILCILAIDISTSLQIIQAVCLVSLCLPLVIGELFKKMPQYKKGLVNYFNMQIPSMNKMVPLLIISGLFGKALSLLFLISLYESHFK